jgi:LacI family transcriptional regulator
MTEGADPEVQSAAAAVTKRPRVTLADVATKAGVSAATVSFVINDKPGVTITEATRKRVLRAVRDLGYRPNAMAKNLAQGHSRFIGLVADAIATTPFAGQIISGAQDEAWKHGYVLLVANTEGNPEAEKEAIAMMLEHKVRGILYSTWFHRSAEIPDALREAPFVLVNCFGEQGDDVAVVPDEVQGGYAAARILLEKGHRRIAFINSDLPAPATTGRLEGYRSALAEFGVAYDPALVLRSAPDQEGGYLAAQELLAIEQPVSGVFCYNDRMAMGLFDALRERGMTAPRDIAVVGFDNQEVIAGHLRPPLTTVALPHYELGAEGVRALLNRTPARGVVRVECPTVERQSA